MRTYGTVTEPLDPDTDDILLGLLARDFADPLPKREPPPPQQEPPPPQQRQAADPVYAAFDKAEFLAHMRRVKERRQAEARDRHARERAALDRLLVDEGGHYHPPPQKALWLTQQHQAALDQALQQARQSIQLQAVTDLYVGPVLPQTNVEPEFDPGRMPGKDELHLIGSYALGYLLATRSWAKGLPRLGQRMASVQCKRDADAIAHAMMAISRELPVTAQLSAVPFDVPSGVLGVVHHLRNVAMRVASFDNGRQLAFDLTWDHIAPI